jgi:transposase-like protein
MGLRGVCDNCPFGPTRNPFDVRKNTGAPSGGSAAVADGLVPFEEGTDAGGSIHIPAAWCNVVGFQASFGRVPVVMRPNAFAGDTPFVFEGAISRTVEDAALALSYARYRFPPDVIHEAIWLYLRFTLSFRDVEDLLAERGFAVSYETVRRWVNHFGPMIAAHLRKRRPEPHATWHLDEVYLKIDGRMVYLWRAVDAEGEFLEVLVQSKRSEHAALKLMRKLLKKYAFAPERLVTDDFRSYMALRPAISASSTCMSADNGKTIGP